MAAKILAFKKPAGLRCSLFPTGYGVDRNWLYAFGLDDGRIKIGVTFKPRDRIAQQRKAHALRITWVHVFAPLPSNRGIAAERAALRIAEQVAQRLGRTEFFWGLSKQQVIDICRQGMVYALAQPVASAPAPDEEAAHG